MKVRLKLTSNYHDKQIEKAISRINAFRVKQGQEEFTGWEITKQPLSAMDKEPAVVETSDYLPCSDCGNIFFIRTGTCHVCQTCGSSQGCS